MLLTVFGLVAAACGDDDEGDVESSDTTAAGGAGVDAGSDVKACQVTDTGGVDDRSFNQTAAAGLERAESELGVETDVLESQSEADFAPNIDALVEAECDLVITVGFLLGDATQAAAEQHADTNFAIVDFAYEEEIENVRGLTFKTDEAAFLAGYLAAGMTETGKVGTYGGLNIPTVTVFMTGFEAGVGHYNMTKGTQVELLGWSSAESDGLFTGDFEDQTKGRQTTETLLDQGADIIMPVAGPVGLGTLEAVEAAGGDAKVIWVDTDGCESVADSCELFLTSVQKRMDNAVFDTIEQVVNGEFEGGIYEGTLENEGVDIAPFHEFDSEVPQELKDELEEIRQQIVDGELDPSSTGG